MKPIVLLAAWLALAPTLFAASATFFSVADTTISPDDEALADAASATMIVGHLPNPEVASRALLRFDLSSLPSGVVVTSATVEVTASVVADATANTHLLHRLTLGWTEAGASWTDTGGDFWENAGGDFEPASDVAAPIAGVGAYVFTSTPGLISTVQQWATNAASNFGWALRSAAEDSGRNGRRFNTREAASGRPKLVVGYFVPPPPVTLVNPRIAGANFRFEFTALPGSSYTVESRPRADSGTWTTVSTHPAPLSPTVIPVAHALTTSNRFYRVVSP
jgi:hypothetical protein